MTTMSRAPGVFSAGVTGRPKKQDNRSRPPQPDSQPIQQDDPSDSARIIGNVDDEAVEPRNHATDAGVADDAEPADAAAPDAAQSAVTERTNQIDRPTVGAETPGGPALAVMIDQVRIEDRPVGFGFTAPCVIVPLITDQSMELVLRKSDALALMAAIGVGISRASGEYIEFSTHDTQDQFWPELTVSGPALANVTANAESEPTL